MKNLLLFAQGKINTSEIGYNGVQDPNSMVTGILNAVYMWAGIIAVIVIIVAGYFYVTSGGNSSNTKRARETIIYAVVGLAFVLMAFVITQFVIGRF